MGFPGIPTNLINLLEQHGRLSLQQITEHAATYVAGNNRAAQDSFQLYACLAASLSKTGLHKIKLYKDQYVINNVPSEPAFLKVIIRESHLDTTAAKSIVRTELSSLDTYMVMVGSDIAKFNLHVKDLLQSLAAYGETTLDLMENLYKGYKMASDHTFTAYIGQKESDHEDGNGCTTEELMGFALAKYKTLTAKKLWNAPSEESEKIIALEAQVKKLTSDVARGKPPPRGPPKRPDPKGPQKKPFNNGKKVEQKGRFKKDERFKSNPWMIIAPKPGEPHNKQVNGKPFIFCTKHQAWGGHPTSECRGAGLEAKANKPEPGLRLARALASLAEATEEDSE